MKNLALLLVAVLFLVSISEQVDKKDTADEKILAYLAEKGWKAVKHESGLYVVIDKPGEGPARPVITDEVTVFYAGYLLAV